MTKLFFKVNTTPNTIIILFEIYKDYKMPALRPIHSLVMTGITKTKIPYFLITRFEWLLSVPGKCPGFLQYPQIQ